MFLEHLTNIPGEQPVSKIERVAVDHVLHSSLCAQQQLVQKDILANKCADNVKSSVGHRIQFNLKKKHILSFHGKWHETEATGEAI